jgi:membrane-associated HD superfamily phosphohydrolase
MARQYGLPRAIFPFIAEHHGTTVIEYFYNEARKAAEDEEEIDDTEYRYPGPKPQSKETAILMLADSSEGAVRAIKEPTAPKIEDKVHEIVMKRLLDGQLNESGLTLKELQTVEQSLCKSLISVYHGRIPYPDDEKDEEKAAPEPAVAESQPPEGEAAGNA